MIFLSSEFRTNSFKNTIRVSRSLEPDLARRLCRYNPSPNCLQRSSADDAGRKRIKYSKTCVKQPLSKRPKIGFQDQLSLNQSMQVKSIAECSNCILQYFRPSLSYRLSSRSLFLSIFEWPFTQVLLYVYTYSKCHECWVPGKQA